MELLLHIGIKSVWELSSFIIPGSKIGLNCNNYKDEKDIAI
ncbi:MAG: hypothetical protein PF487_08240 [Bacteroidales bacterium]|jgi:hypothetical protein|nr:hypothetical protein [Bacteroidales bacterium]